MAMCHQLQELLTHQIGMQVVSKSQDLLIDHQIRNQSLQSTSLETLKQVELDRLQPQVGPRIWSQ